jgi:hypothetical protein
MASRQSDSADTTVVFSVICVHYCYIYSTVLLFWRLFMLYIYSEIPDNQHYRTTHSPY